MDLSAYVFDALPEDARLLLCRGHDRTRAGRRFCLTPLDERGHGYILTSVNGRVALASRRAIGAEVS
jgi:hypothetical protein